MSGSVQVKAKRSWESRCKGTVKRASLRSRREYWVVEGGTRERIVKGFGTIGCIGITAWLMIRRSGLSSTRFFLPAKLGCYMGN